MRKHAKVFNRLAGATMAAALLACPGPAAANFVIGAEHPPFGDKGYAIQFDWRANYQYSSTFINPDGSTRPSYTNQNFGLFIFRAFIPNWMARLSIPYSNLNQNGNSRWGWGDTVMEVGASRQWGNTRMRALLYAKAPTGDFDPGKAVNIGSHQWDLGPNLWLTQYLFDKRVDLDAFTQYLVRFTNHYTGITPGKQFSYAATAAYLFNAGVPVRLGVETRGTLDDPTTRGGVSVGAAKQQYSIGPAAQLNLSRFLKGLTLWPTALYDFYDRNNPRTTLLYLKVQYNY